MRMLTAEQAGDVVNLVESSAVASLEADAWLGTGGTGEIAFIGVGGPDSRPFGAHELPALTVSAMPEAFNGEVPEGVRGIRLRLTVGIVCASGDRAALRERIREVCARVGHWIAEQNGVDGYGLDGLLADGSGSISPGGTQIGETAANGVWRSEAVVTAEVLLYAGL
jgi:hypothetical protein